MNTECLQVQEWSALLQESATPPSERVIGHLADCRHCREQLAQRQLQQSLQLAHPRLSRPHTGLRRAYWPVVAASLLLAAVLFVRPWAEPPGPVQMRTLDARPLHAVPMALPQHREQSLHLEWTAQPGALGYRLSCYRGADPAWLQRNLEQPEIVLPSMALGAAPASSVCRLDAQLADGEWVLGDELALSLTP
jgi:hypothetical protein